MSEHSKFNFETVFTPGAPHPDDDPHALMDPADVPVYSQNQVDAALAEARNESATAASDEASHNSDAVANQILAQIQDQFTRLGTFQDSVVRAIHADAVELSLVIGQKLARSLMKREPKAEIEALVVEMLQQHAEIGSTPKIMIRVHPEIAPNISSRIDILKNNVAFTGEVLILPADNLGPTDCSVEWADGGAVRDQKVLEEEVTAAIERYLGAIEGAAGVTEHAPQHMADPSVTPPAPVAAEVVAVEPAPPAETTQPPSVIDEIVAEARTETLPQEPAT